MSEPREWADIDREWLQGYLEEHRLASSFDLEDELIGAQVSWILSTDEWAMLRAAWDEHKGPDGRGAGGLREQGSEVPPAAVVQPQPPAEGEPEEGARPQSLEDEAAESEVPLVEEPIGPVVEPEEPPAELHRAQELVPNALSDWAAFKELFQSCPDGARVAEWEALAESPVALFERAKHLISLERARAEQRKNRSDKAFEEDVSRAQNIIAGYFIFCRKRGILPTHEHLLGYIPVLRTDHSLEAVAEAWKRELKREP